MKTKQASIRQPSREVVTSLIRTMFRQSPFTVRTEHGETLPPQPLTLTHVTPNTRMGANVVADAVGATFRVWAPAAREVRVRWNYTKSGDGLWSHNDEALLAATGDGIWAGFVPDIEPGERYMYYVVGPQGGTAGLKRDPYARELTQDPAWPECQCVLVDPTTFPWHDSAFSCPAARDLILYQLHVGVWSIPLGRANGTFLDVAERVPELQRLGVNALQPLPVTEFPTQFSLGYNGVDMFSPEMQYAVDDDDPALPEYLSRLNAVLLEGKPDAVPYTLADIRGSANQLKVLVDLCHVHGIAVLFDVVYNHAGGGFGSQGLYFFDRRPEGNHNDSLYFTDRGWAGGLVFAYWNDHVRQFLIDNAVSYLDEVHGDGFRYDEVSVIKNEGGAHGWQFCQDVTDTCRFVKPSAVHIAECWPVEQAVLNRTDIGGAGFDATQNDGLREAIRAVIGQAAQGASANLDLDRVARELASPILNDSWRAVQCVENHDLVWQGRGWRIPRIADGTGDASSWYVRSRSRVALGLVMTAPGIPHLFMGQEILEKEQWTDDPQAVDQTSWQDAEADPHRRHFGVFLRDLLRVRRQFRGLRGDGLNVFHIHNDNRVLAYHRWVPGEGADVVVVVNLSEAVWQAYELGFPADGRWSEVFNSDYYDQLPNPVVQGNGGSIVAVPAGRHGLPASAVLTLPANGLLIFAR